MLDTEEDPAGGEVETAAKLMVLRAAEASEEAAVEV